MGKGPWPIPFLSVSDSLSELEWPLLVGLDIWNLAYATFNYFYPFIFMLSTYIPYTFYRQASQTDLHCMST